MVISSIPSSISQSLRTMSVALALLGFASLGSHAAAQGQAAPEREAVDYRKLAGDFARKTAGLGVTIAALPRMSMDPRAVVAAVGKDPRALTAWVTEETRWVPYRGILRGPTGVLMDRRGNTADRALLLMELLHSGGHAPTLHRGSLSADAAAALFASITSLDPGGTDKGAVPTPTGDELGTLAQRAGMTVAEARAELLAAQSRAQRAAEMGIGRVMGQAAELTAFVDPERAAAARVAERTEAIETLRDHYWVTLEIEGVGQRFDPLHAWLQSQGSETAAAGPPVSEAAYSHEQRHALPDELYHTLVVRFEVERTDGSKIERRVALKHSVRPYELGAHSLTLACAPLGFLPPPDAELAGLAPAERAARQRTALLKVKEWLPQIVVRGQLNEDKSFRSDGTLNASPQKGTGQVVASAAGTLAGLGTGSTKQRGEATAVFVTLVARRPGPTGPLEERHERVVFDLLGEARRSAGEEAPALDETGRLTRALVGGYAADIAPLVAVPSEAYLHGLALTSTWSNRDAIIKMTLAQAEEDADKALQMATSAAQSLQPRPVVQWTWGHLRRVYGGSDPRVFVDRINLLSNVRVTTLPSAAAEGLMVLHEGIDVIMNHVGIAHTRTESPTDSAALRLRQGVADTVLEATVAASHLGREVENTSVSFAGKSSAWTRAVAAAVDAPRTVSNDFAGGLAVAPPAADGAPRGPNFYWRIDPGTGETLGMGPDGWGQSSAETLVQLQLAAIFIEMFRCSGQPRRARPKCLAGAICSYIGLAVGSLTLNPIAGFGAGQLCTYATR